METEHLQDGRDYQVGLNQIQEAIISSHFMHRMSQDLRLRLYDDKNFRSRLLVIDEATLARNVIPTLVSSCAAFCEERAKSARTRALTKYREYGYESPDRIGVSECITEVIFDKEFSRSAGRYNSREAVNQRIGHIVRNRLPIEMAIPALPFKIPSPLKSRGPLPDLGEVNFLLSMYEIVKTIQLIYKEEMPPGFEPTVRFTIVSDGSRFDEAINESNHAVKSYQADILSWIQLLGIGDYVRIFDYRALLQEGLPKAMWETKLALFQQARKSYARALWPVFNPDDMVTTFEAAARAELDPEHDNPEGRFVSLFKSLVYTVKYKAIENLRHLSEEQRLDLYRELTAHIFQPYAKTSASEGFHQPVEVDGQQGFVLTREAKEALRHSMLAEAWSAAIDYIAEIKSDRDLKEDPILACLPGYLRWTIHAKQGQIAVATPPILGMNVQAWAGSAVFRPTGRGKIRLCTLPALHLEATGSIPVMAESDDERHARQPLFYIDHALGVSDMASFLAALNGSFTRRRFS